MSHAKDSISWSDAHDRAIPVRPRQKITDQDLQALIVQALGNNRLTFAEIRKQCRHSDDRMRAALRDLCIAEVVRVEHRPEAPALRGSFCMARPGPVYHVVGKP